MSYSETLRAWQRDVPAKLHILAESLEGIGVARLLRNAAFEIEWWRARHKDEEFGDR